MNMAVHMIDHRRGQEVVHPVGAAVLGQLERVALDAVHLADGRPTGGDHGHVRLNARDDLVLGVQQFVLNQ